jgi:hypothetical protein
MIHSSLLLIYYSQEKTRVHIIIFQVTFKNPLVILDISKFEDYVTKKISDDDLVN